MLTTAQATEASVQNTYPPVGLPHEERAELIAIYKSECERIDAEWRKWLAQSFLVSEFVGSELETFIWAKVSRDANSSTKNTRADKEAHYKELVHLVSIARD